MRRTPELLKNYSFHNFLNRSNSTTFLFTIFQPKFFICIIHLSLFMYAIQNNIILSKSGIVLVKVKSALCLWNSRPISLKEF